MSIGYKTFEGAFPKNGTQVISTRVKIYWASRFLAFWEMTRCLSWGWSPVKSMSYMSYPEKGNAPQHLIEPY